MIFQINGENVVNATHEHTVELIKRSGDTLAMRVITVKPLSTEGHERDIHMDGTRTLPLKKKGEFPNTPTQTCPPREMWQQIEIFIKSERKADK